MTQVCIVQCDLGDSSDSWFSTTSAIGRGSQFSSFLLGPLQLKQRRLGAQHFVDRLSATAVGRTRNDAGLLCGAQLLPLIRHPDE